MDKPKNITKGVTLYYLYFLAFIIITIYLIQSTNMIGLYYDYYVISRYLIQTFNNNLLYTVTNVLFAYTTLHLLGFLLCILLSILLY